MCYLKKQCYAIIDTLPQQLITRLVNSLLMLIIHIFARNSHISVSFVSYLLLTMQGKSSIPHSQELHPIGKERSRVGTSVEFEMSFALERLLLRSDMELSTMCNEDGVGSELNGSWLHENQLATWQTKSKPSVSRRIRLTLFGQLQYVMKLLLFISFFWKLYSIYIELCSRGTIQ